MGCASNTETFGAGPHAWLLDNQTRLHLQHGPIDLIIDATGDAREVRRAFKQAFVSFQDILTTLAAQLPVLRTPYVGSDDHQFDGSVANRMKQAVQPFAECRVTPMAAVAGAVADHVLSCLLRGRTLSKVQVNNGGDIALFLDATSEYNIGICCDPEKNSFTDSISLTAQQGIGGVATSGWKGRSHSLGIADAVTVLANNAASADVAATLIANAVDIPSAAEVIRMPANELQPDSDLNSRLVTVNVLPLSTAQCKQALNAGENCAKKMLALGQIHSCYLHVQGQTRTLSLNPTSHVFPRSERYAYR